LDVGEGVEVEGDFVIGAHHRYAGGLELPCGDSVDFHEVACQEEEKDGEDCGI
jgi:hypothetical protein